MQTQVLIVDDEKVIQMLLQTVLEQDGHRVHLATTATEGIDAAASIGEIDVALVDKNLPDRSGLEVIRELKAAQPDCEVILITGYASLDSAIEALKVGAFDYVLKPFEDIDILRVKVRQAVDKRRSGDRYHKLFDALPEAIVVYAANGRVNDANAAALALYGKSAREIRGMCADDLAAAREGMNVEITSSSFELGRETMQVEVVRAR